MIRQVSSTTSCRVEHAQAEGTIEDFKFPARLDEVAREKAIEASATDMQNLGTTLETLSADHPISSLIRRSEHFWRPEATTGFHALPFSGLSYFMARPPYVEQHRDWVIASAK